MKKILIVITFFFIVFSANAQYKEQLRFIHAYEWTGDRGFFGMNFGVEYFFLNYLSVHPSFTFYTPATGNARGFDINARYYFTEKDKQWYALVGYGHYTRVFEFNPIGKLRYNSINLGAGGMIKFRDEIGINPEIRFQGFDRNAFIYKIGIVYFVN